MRYRTPSMMPQARLHPSAPMSIVRISSRPASATLSEPVNESTMIKPKSTSEIRSCGSRTRLEVFMGSSAIRVLSRCFSVSSIGRMKTRSHRGRQTANDQVHCFLWRIGDVAEADFFARENAFLHHFLAPLAKAFPEFRPHQDQRKRTDLLALN